MFKTGFRGGSGGGGGGGGTNLVWASIAAVDSPYTFSGSVNSVEVDVTSGAVDVVLPAASAHSGKIFSVNHKAGSLSLNPITVKTTGSDMINGQSQIIIQQTQSTLRASSNGAAWIVI